MIRQKHPRAIVIFQHRKVPNGVNLFNRLRAEKLILSHINYCIPSNNEANLLDALNKLCGIEYPAEVNFPINRYAEPLAIDNELESKIFIKEEPNQCFDCNYCNRGESTLMNLYIHREACKLDYTTPIHF
jgi:hypothetical protein